MKVKRFIAAAIIVAAALPVMAGNGMAAEANNKVFTLMVYGGEIPDIKPTFEEEHYLGGVVTKKWNTFICNYTRTYDVEVGLSASGTEFRKPAIFKAVERANKYVKKSLKTKTISRQEATDIMVHVLDCANIICLEPDTEEMEHAAADARTGEEAVAFFNSIQLKNA